MERATEVHLCRQNAATWWGHLRLPSRACKFSSSLVAKVNMASGQAASALHVMAILQVCHSKALKELLEGGPNPKVLQKLC